jgi:hypothetical protein
VASWGGKRVGAGRKPGDIDMADRIKRYAVAEKAARYADEIIDLYTQVLRNKDEDTLVRMFSARRPDSPDPVTADALRALAAEHMAEEVENSAPVVQQPKNENG